MSFQLQADTGRGEWRERDIVINKQSVCEQVEKGSSLDLPWDVIQVGHSDCHFYMPTLVVNNTVYPLVDNKAFFSDFLKDFNHISWDRQQSKLFLVAQFFTALAARPRWWWRLSQHGLKLAKVMAADFFRARGKVNQLTFFVQNFMDAQELQQDRIDACSFMVMTHTGPVSMCQHNAKRDDYILNPLDIKRSDGSTLNYQPLKRSSNNNIDQPLQ